LNNKEIISVKTPCIGVCSTALGGKVCRGCKRFAHEVIDWNRYENSQKLVIEHRLGELLSTIVQNYCVVYDSERLEQTLKAHAIRFSEHRDHYCQVFALLKAGASTINDPEAFGFSIKANKKDLSLKVICEEIDEAFYALSVAHYEHCYFLY
jgi:hypothetical protein